MQCPSLKRAKFVLVLGVALITLTMNSRVFESRVAERQPAGLAEADPKTSDFEKKATSIDGYRFHRKMKIILNQNDVLADVEYRGRIWIQWIEADDNGRSASIGMDVESVPDSFTMAKFKIGEDFTLKELETSPIQSEHNENLQMLLRDLVSIYAWNGNEDTTGVYTSAIHTSNDVNGVKSVIKKKVRYLDPALSAWTIDQSTHEIRVQGGQQAELISASGVETIHQGSEIAMKALYEMIHDKSISEKVHPEWSLKLRSAHFIKSPIHLDRNPTAEQGLDMAEIEQRLMSLRGGDAHSRIAFFKEASKKIRLVPTSISSFVRWLKSSEMDPSQKSALVGVLASSHDPLAQKALIEEVMESKIQNPAYAHMVLNALTTAKTELASDTKGSLIQLVDQKSENRSFSLHAALVLGSAGEIRFIEQKLAESRQSSEILLYLDALGNSGRSEALEILSTYFQSTDPMIREKAIFSLRFIKDPRVELAIDKAMQDSSLSVRMAAVRVMGFQGASSPFVPILENRLQFQTNPELRAACGLVFRGNIP